ncbi:hypothetical protein B0I32_114263 [Nonomuraea fuscirosea]|uniref:Uncharacterized protein n=1 Tax=Nonomuraea fuscirosea TaxID=1291556 RepID=A0A2T0MTK0_9ACTN|nr:hypothetical protein [Nonomuraea fuscirosea]PRX61894.1 hypothetical protein B0I32_114263 [Nonomuraea fuscirosea]
MVPARTVLLASQVRPWSVERRMTTSNAPWSAQSFLLRRSAKASSTSLLVFTTAGSR